MPSSFDRPLSRSITLIAVLGLASAIAACAATREAPRSVKPSGFLGDYSQLRKGEAGEASLIYINPHADWAQYDAILIDSVSFWHTDNPELTPEEQEALGSYFFKVLKQQLGEDYRIVEKPGPRTLRLSVALTSAKGANVAGNVITGVLPQFRLLTALGGMTTKTAVFVGEASVEAKMEDSLTGTRLAAAVDERWGTKSFGTMLSTWGDVEKACDAWAEAMRQRLESLKAGHGGRT